MSEDLSDWRNEKGTERVPWSQRPGTYVLTVELGRVAPQTQTPHLWMRGNLLCLTHEAVETLYGSTCSMKSKHTQARVHTRTHAPTRIYSCDQGGRALMRSHLISGLAHGQIFKWVKFSIVAFLLPSLSSWVLLILSSLSSWVLLIELLNAIILRDPHGGTSLRQISSFYFLLSSIKNSPMKGFSYITKVL